MVYSLSGAKFGFPLRKVLPENLMRKCGNQDWSGLQIRSGPMEGNGIFAQEHFLKNTPLCNYGGSTSDQELCRKVLIAINVLCSQIM